MAGPLSGRLGTCDCQPDRAALASASAQDNWPGFDGAGTRTRLAKGLTRPGGVRADGQHAVDLAAEAEAMLGWGDVRLDRCESVPGQFTQ
jgi:hypothetical protein